MIRTTSRRRRPRWTAPSGVVGAGFATKWNDMQGGRITEWARDVWRSQGRLLVPALIVTTAIVTMVVGVGHVERIFFDEVYYVNDARDLLAAGVEDGFVVHPPLGKLLIASGIWLVGDTPFGWRIIGALLGVVSVWLTYLIARRQGLRLAGAGLAGMVLALDGVYVAQARTGMLDIHLAFFVVLGAYALVRDRDRLRTADDEALAIERLTRRTTGPQLDPASRHPDPPRALAPALFPDAGSRDASATDEPTASTTASGLAADPDPATTNPTATVAARSGPTWTTEPDDAPVGSDPEPRPGSAGPAPVTDAPAVHTALPRVGRGWLVVAGIAFGAATAVKWSGAVALVAAGALWLGIELARRQRVTGRLGTRLPGALLLGVVVLGLVPVATYGLTWIPWYVAFDNTWIASAHCGEAGDQIDCDGLVGETRALVSYHERMLKFHEDLEAEHSYRAPAWGWPIQLRPVVYYYETCGDDRLNRVENTDSDGEVSTPEPCRVDQGEAAEILSLGNPASWWLLLACLPLVGLLVARRDRQVMVPLVLYAVQFLFWVAVLPLVAVLGSGTTVTRPVFNFYTVPLVPFMALLLALVVSRVTARDTWIRATVFGLIGGGVVLLGSYGLPALGQAVAEPARWYAVGIAAMVGGALAVRPATTTTWVRPDRRWPTLVVLALVVGIGLFFLPVWTGMTLPTPFVKAHWWLPTWI